MKTALVTGACIHTGVAIVEKFASEGYGVVFTGRNAETVREKERTTGRNSPTRRSWAMPSTPFLMKEPWTKRRRRLWYNRTVLRRTEK